MSGCIILYEAAGKIPGEVFRFIACANNYADRMGLAYMAFFWVMRGEAGEEEQVVKGLDESYEAKENKNDQLPVQQQLGEIHGCKCRGES